jgi:hypothetical protein
MSKGIKMKIKNKITIATFVMLTMTSLTVSAQTVTYPKWQDVYTPADLAAGGCSQTVMTDMFNAAAQRYMPLVPATNQALVVDQVNKAPDNKSMMNCIDRAMNSVRSITNSIDKVLGIISGGVSPGSVVDSITKQMSNLACSQADNYITGKIYNSTNGIMGKVNMATGVATNGVYVNTGLGQVNVGGGAIQPRTNATPTTDAVNRVLK